jgi:hypothetical protein
LSRWSQKVVSWYNGSFHIKTSITLPIIHAGMNKNTCSYMIRCQRDNVSLNRPNQQVFYCTIGIFFYLCKSAEKCFHNLSF